MAAKREAITDFQDRMLGLIRALGLHQPNHTPCGHPVAVAEAHAMLELSRDPGLSQNDLAIRLCLEKSTVSRIVTLLQRRGWITRTRDRSDARIVRVHLTTEGRQAARALAYSRAKKFKSIYEAIPATERASVTSALNILIEVIHET